MCIILFIICITCYVKIKVNGYITNEIIKMIREYVDKTQFEFADDTHISIIAIQTYEYDTVNYTFETLLKIAKYYHFDITIESTSKTDKMINHKY